MTVPCGERKARLWDDVPVEWRATPATIEKYLQTSGWNGENSRRALQARINGTTDKTVCSAAVVVFPRREFWPCCGGGVWQGRCFRHRDIAVTADERQLWLFNINQYVGGRP